VVGLGLGERDQEARKGKERGGTWEQVRRWTRWGEVSRSRHGGGGWELLGRVLPLPRSDLQPGDPKEKLALTAAGGGRGAIALEYLWL
jgi:hypothetical protein